ncbi:MAG: RNA 2',3'-cyclic phosphodiesterase [Aquificae bacterium]|nr:RNA 2',3'-cyclic phosphodiesterase [Aquificota bacterium]
MKKRIFIGCFVKIPNFSRVYREIKRDFSSVSGRWIPEENFHITFKFLGDVENHRIPTVAQALSSVINRDIQANIQFKGLGAFPNFHNPKVLFVNVLDNNGVLEEIFNKVNGKLSLLGFQTENRAFKPHITLKRIKGYNREQFIQGIRKYKDTTFGGQEVVKVSIIQSILKPDGAVYKQLDI